MIVAVALVAVGVGVSYGGGKATTTLTMWSYDNQDPGLEPVLKQLSKEFEASHPGVKINLVFKDFNSLVGTVPRALASGSGPDVTEGNQGYQTDAQLVKAKLIIPLTKYVNKYGWNKLYAPSTWGMFRWTPDGKSFGKGPVWGLAQTGQNIAVFYNKKKLKQAGLNPNAWPKTYAGFEAMLATLRAKLPKSDPVIMEGNKEGYGFIHLFGGIWGASEKPSAIRNWIYHVPGSRYDTPGTIKALGRLQAWAKNGYFNPDYNAVGYDAAATLFAKGKGAMWIGGDWDSTIIKTLGAQNLGVMPIPPGPSGQWAGDRRPLRAVAHLVEDEERRPRRRVAQLRDHLDEGEAADVRATSSSRPTSRAKPPTSDPYLTQVYNAFTKVANDDGLLLYTDWASPSMYTTLQNQYQNLLAGRTTPQAMAKAVQDDWAKFDKTLQLMHSAEWGS